MKILIVEDTKAQADWAKEKLKGHNVKIVDSTKKGSEELFSDFAPDLLLTDLILPQDSDSEYESIRKPDYKNGVSLFKRGAELLRDGKIKGLALVSNFEHHFPEGGDDISKKLEELIWFSNEFGINFSLTYGGEIESNEKKGPFNMLSFFDQSYTTFPSFLSPKGEVVSHQAVKDLYEKVSTNLINHYHAVINENYQPLKPWGEIVNALSKNIH